MKPCIRMLPLFALTLLLVPETNAQGMAGSRAMTGGMARPVERPGMPMSPGMMTSPGMMMPMSPYNAFANPYGTMPLNPYSGMMPSSVYAGGTGYGAGNPMVGTATGAANSGTTALRTYTGQDQSGTAGDVSTMLAASGVPNDGGHVRWPVGLTALAAPQAEELRSKIDALFQRAGTLAKEHSFDAQIAPSIRKAVGKLRNVLLRDKEERFALPLAVYEESERFLNRLDRAEHVLRTAVPATTAAKQGVMMEVGLYDDFLAPDTLYATVGTTVSWRNRGMHGHTVTADDGAWTSKQLGMNDSFEHTFASAGTYSYHCILHAQEMHGVVVVK